MSCLAQIEDPRRAGYACRHDLQEIQAIAVCAVLCDMNSFEDMAFWAEHKVAWLKRFLKLKGGIPSHDTFNRVFRILDPRTFEDAFRRWVGGIVPAVGSGTLAVDGKTVRGSGDGNNGPIHVVSAFATDCGLVLGQQKVDGKSNEISAIPELLDALLIKGYLVSLDAMGCQNEIAAKILEKKADYLLAVKGNQPGLQSTLQERFGLAQRQALEQAGQYAQCTEQSHGRFVWQGFWVAPNAGDVDTARWPGCRMLGMVESLRKVGDKESEPERRYYISSRVLSAQAFASAVRAHWGIENNVHWMLDVNFREDAATVRKDNAADNLSRLKRIVLNLLKVETATASFGKVSLAKKRKLAAWDDGYRMAMLGITPDHDG
ncbi:ISAs1 family transposase [Aromatoleum toluclasticum]|uniref:ISAs1 family transposase n=1 Tax=Aromatoleum toluclasticum TaxID=92003 RepID=UPI001D19540E|nr:ISAs1 family transposase [Aromatoleum toluclasticum]MCC4118457.1 ISAs1 family transposase [Aromatoleum toluclasticum]